MRALGRQAGAKRKRKRNLEKLEKKFLTNDLRYANIFERSGETE